ncbi:efflux RND transporter periplasmic adaptor subunit [Rhodopseudomonas palustris]|uniref:efflux RND transporter periplasmic adaptor subunit n=1 Tax=Rhodopseudomonas palustris TaxID=1076 RepID=UPI0002F46153
MALIVAATSSAYVLLITRSNGVGINGAIHYRTASVERRPFVAVVRASGSLQPISQVLVGSQVSGQVVEILVKPNDHVERDQVIARISSDQIGKRYQGLLAQLASARADVSLREARVELSAVQVERARSEVADREAKLRNAGLAEDIAGRQLARRRELSKTGAISVADLDSVTVQSRQAETTTASAEAQLATARIAVDAARQEHEIARRELVLATATVDIQQLKAEEAAVELEHTNIVAPVRGVILQRTVELGQTVAASFATPTLFTLAESLERMELHLVIDESAVKRVRRGQQVIFSVPAQPLRELKGTILAIRVAPQINQNVVSYTALVSVENPDGELFPGMTATARILTDEIPEALVVPNAGLRWRPPNAKPEERSTQTVYVLDRPDAPRPVPVEIGVSDGSVTTVLAGAIHAGDRVILGTGAANGGPRISLQ